MATGPSVAIKAIAAGRNAAANISKYMGFPQEAPAALQEGNLRFDQEKIHVEHGVRDPERPMAERSLMAEDASTISAEEAIAEAGRCMNCGCYSVNASDMATMLLALDASVVTTAGTCTISDFFEGKLRVSDRLKRDELIKEVLIPKKEGWSSTYRKFRLRDAIDFALVSVAASSSVKDGIIEDIRLAFGGVAPIAFRAYAVEDLLKGKKPTAELAAKAGDLAVRDAVAMKNNHYKIEALRSLVKDYVLSLV